MSGRAKPFVFIALDGLVSDHERTMAIATRLVQEVQSPQFGFKINNDYFLEHGVGGTAIKIIRDQLKRSMFADLKMHNGSRTITSAVELMASCGMSYMSVNAQLADQLTKPAKRARELGLTLLGLTVMTHYDDEYCNDVLRRASVIRAVKAYANIAVENGCPGIILPGTALAEVADLDCLKVVPGIRPDWYKDDRHEQATVPREAVDGGADIIVVGSPVMNADDPGNALQRILSEIDG